MFRIWLWIATRHWMGGLLQHILLFTWEMGFKSSEKWVKTGLVVLPGLRCHYCSPQSCYKRELVLQMYNSNTVPPKCFPVMGILSLSGPLCEWHIGAAFLGLSWAASTASCVPNPQNTSCTQQHWPSFRHYCGRIPKRCATMKQNGKEIHLKK